MRLHGNSKHGCVRTFAGRATSSGSTPFRTPGRTCPTTWTHASWCSIDHPYSKEAGNRAEAEAKAILKSRGNTPRLFQNTLVFLAVDQARLQDLDEAARRYLAWDSIVAEKETLNLDPHQVKQAETQKGSADGAVTARLPEAYQWLLVPVQTSPQAAVEWQAFRLSGQDALAVRASKKLRNDELLVTALAGTRLRMDLDRVPLWRGDHVAIKQLAEDFARYLYLPRLKEPAVLVEAARDGVALVTWEQDSFAYADAHDEAAGRYRGLRVAQHPPIVDQTAPGLLVRPEVARRQMDAETQRAPVGGAPGTPTDVIGGPDLPGQGQPGARRSLGRLRFPSRSDSTGASGSTRPALGATPGASPTR
jgi:hypothetical protein